MSNKRKDLLLKRTMITMVSLMPSRSTIVIPIQRTMKYLSTLRLSGIAVTNSDQDVVVKLNLNGLKMINQLSRIKLK